MELKIEWTVGFDDKNIFFIDKSTLIFVSGQYVHFYNEEQEHSYLALPSYAATKLAVHPSENIFALAETQKINPYIYLYQYPSLENFGIIQNFSKMDVLYFSFSYSDYLVIISGIPHINLSIWNYKDQVQLCTKPLDIQNITDFSVSPANWKNIAIISHSRIFIYVVEYCGSLFLVKEKYINLPPLHSVTGSIQNAISQDSRITVAKSSSRISYDFDLPPSAIAGLSCNYFKEFVESQDQEIRCISASHVWSGTGDIYFGCEEGQLIKLDMENMVFKMIFNPVKDKSDVLRIATPSSRLDDVINLANNIKQICFAKRGIYMAGHDGILRIAKQIDNEVSDNIEEVHQIKAEITNIKFNYNYSKLAVVSSHGRIDILSDNENIEPPKTVYKIGRGYIVGIGIIPDGIHIVTLKDKGKIQVWKTTDQSLVSTTNVYYSASSMSVSPLWNMLAVGLDNGFLEMFDMNDPSKPKSIHKIKLHKRPIIKLQFSKRSQIILTGSNDGNVVVLSGLVTEGFKVIGIISFEGILMDLTVFQNPTADEVAQIAISSQTHNAIIGVNKLVYFEISPAVINDPKNFYENINGTLEEEVIKKMCLNFESPTYGCVLGVQAPEEKSPVLYSVEIDSRCLCKYQIPSVPPKKEEENNKEKMLKLIQSNRILIPGLSKSSAETGFLNVDGFSNSELDDVTSGRVSLHPDISKRDSFRSLRRSSLAKLPVTDNIDWKELTKIKEKLNQYDTLTEKHQQQLKLIDQLEAGNKASRLRPIKIYNEIIHQDPRVFIQSSLNSRLIMTYGSEGVIRVLDTKDEKNYTLIQAHQLTCNGIIESGFSFDCTQIFSCGYDKTFCCHNLVMPSSIKLSFEQEYNSLIYKLESKIQQQNEALIAYQNTEVKIPPDEIKTELLKDSTSDSLSSSKREVGEKTWSEKRVMEYQAEEDQQYHELKDFIRNGIESIRKTIEEMLNENDKLSELEKIDRQEFELDMDMKKKIHGDIENQIKEVADEIEQNNLAKQFIWSVIKKECWDQMTVKGRALKAFNSNLEVTNFPLKDRPQNVLDDIDMVIRRRMIEIEDYNDRRIYTEHLQKTGMNKPSKEILFKHESSEDVDEMEEEETKDISHSVKEDNVATSAKYLYSQMELETRDQKIYQIILIKDLIHQTKIQFNKEFTDVFHKKEQEINRIKEKNSRIVKILNDIDMAHLIQPDPELSSLEKPEKLLIVEDHEIKVERYLTEEQKRKLEEDRLADEERKRREKLDNWRERGLEDMMGGVLEVKREDELKKDIPKPSFLLDGKPQEDWTDEEKKIFEEYERKVKELNDEREKYKKQLEAEYKKLSGFIDDAKTGFDEILLNLFNRQIAIQMNIYQEEIKIFRLQWSLLVDEELTSRGKEINDLKESNKLEIKQLQTIINNAKILIEQEQEAYDTLVAEEKVMDKAFRREFIDIHGSMFDHITKLYKRRPRNRLLGTQMIPASQMPNFSKYNPYLTKASSGKQKQFQLETLKNAIQDLDNQDATDTMDQSLYERLCKSRRKRIMKEFDIKQMALEMAEMQAFLQYRLEEEKNLENNEIHLDSLMELLETYRYQFQVNKELQLVVRQGQVEVNAIPGFIHDFTECILLHRSKIEDLNKEIKELGLNKVKHMTKAKDSKKKFIHLEWELRRMLMEYEDLVIKMKEIQCFKITKEVQRYLATNDYDGLINAEIQKMEQTINHMKMHQVKNLDQKKNRLKNIVDNKLVKIKSDNEDISNQLTELNVQVNERKHISRGFPSENVGKHNVELRYQKILHRQRLVDLAKSQAREIAVLRAEVERLRMRTFPALIQHNG